MEQLGEFVVNHWILVSLAVFLSGLLAVTELKRVILGFKDLPPDEVVKQINQRDAVILDVRDDGEYRKGHIVNAIHIPLIQLQGQMAKLEHYRQQPIIVSCQNGQRAAHACVLLKKNGFTDVNKLGGGMTAWHNAHLPVTKHK